MPDAGGELFVHAPLVAPYGPEGRSAALEYQDQPPASAPRYRALVAFAERRPRWWGKRRADPAPVPEALVAEAPATSAATTEVDPERTDNETLIWSTGGAGFAAELGTMAGMAGEFAKRNAKIIGISVDPVADHHRWKDDILSYTGHSVAYPMIGDPEMKVAKLFDMLPASEERVEGRTPADNQTVRTVFVIGPDKKLKLSLTYPMTTGRNFDEILRVIDSMQLTAKHKVATPADWKQGEDVIIASSVSNDEAAETFPGYTTVKPYLRTTPQPE